MHPQGGESEGDSQTTGLEEPPGLGADSSVLEYAAVADDQVSFVASSPSETQFVRSIEPGEFPRRALAPAPTPRLRTRADIFRKHFYPNISATEWNDWFWQYRNRIRDLAGIERILFLTNDEREAILHNPRPLPLGITPYYASLLDARDPQHSLRRTMIPVTAEFRRSPGEADDPLGEEDDSPVPGLVHRYPDRVLFLVTEMCSAYCRFCTRARMVGNHNENPSMRLDWERSLAYIREHHEVRDVVLSGGDALLLSDENLGWLLDNLQRIPHVEMVRIGTKAPVVLPQRITPALVRTLRRYRPLWMSIHFTHPEELTPEVATACNRLADSGIPLGSQTVLMRGINDSVDTMRRLMTGLLRIRVRPYYLYQCDPISGSAHFRTAVSKGLEIIQGLRGHTSGYAVPHYVIDAPGGGGKIPLLPEYVVGREGNDLLLRNYEGKSFRYPDNQAGG
jgi:lysine 2,3-aminomutase